MTGIIALLYSVVAYLVFLATILYAIGFVSGFGVLKTVDSGGPATALLPALIINLVLMAIFAVQHSGMARKPFKRWLTRYVPQAAERSTYVLLASLSLLLLFWLWRPMPTVVWRIDDPTVVFAVQGLSLFGWLLVLAASCMINHFELFGVDHVVNRLAGHSPEPPQFRTPALYGVVRHPIYLGFIIAFWLTPAMTLGHLLFAVVTTSYILVGIAFEERDLIEQFGDQYRRYRERVAMLVPWRRSA